MRNEPPLTALHRRLGLRAESADPGIGDDADADITISPGYL